MRRQREDPHDRNHKQHDTMTTTIKPRWIIKDAIHGQCTIDPRTIRYYRNERHAYGWQIGFQAKVILADGSRQKRTYSALGTNRFTAMANALPR
jgi:hypothetical protein